MAIIKSEADFDRWVAALRSGRYHQTQHKLYGATLDEYCCLGVATVVLCNVAPSVLVNKGLPVEVADQPLISEAFDEQFSVLNDDDQYSFHEIADWAVAHKVDILAAAGVQ